MLQLWYEFIQIYINIILPGLLMLLIPINFYINISFMILLFKGSVWYYKNRTIILRHSWIIDNQQWLRIQNQEILNSIKEKK